ncbi:unnamed protein product [Larinioides sclopetarius]|uniref:Uncharacterized protein n=2 Tax=Larinioides sclopetarius TaxID=280406 RepID=A0AAV2BDC3_9ARAC
MSPKIYTFLLLFLRLTLPALSDKCPDRDKLPTTCECEEQFTYGDVDVELSCTGSTIEELEDTVRVMDKNARIEVQLDDMKLGDLPSRIFYGLNVVRLEISHCELDGLAPPGEAPFQGLEDKLEVLVITSSFTEEVRLTALHSLAHLIRLTELDLSYNAITEVRNDWFSLSPPALSRLSLSNNGIEKLGDRAFENLANLEDLELHGNRFGPIKRSMLPKSAYRLEKLELDNNDFTSVPDDLFLDMPALKVLSIRTNRIPRLEERAFKPIWSQLDVFDARGNPLECDSAMEWLFRVKTEAALVLGSCQGPFGREGMELDDFIENRGQ